MSSSDAAEDNEVDEPDCDESDVEDDVEVPVDIVLDWMASDGKEIPPGYEVGPDGALRISNASEEYKRNEEQAEPTETNEYG